MTIATGNLLQLLYTETWTPNKIDYLKNDKIERICRGIINAPGRRLKFPIAKDHEITEAVQFLLRLVDIPPITLHGLTALKPCVLYLVETALSRIVMIDPKDAVELKAIIEEFYEVIPRISDNPKFNNRPIIGVSPLADFHFEAALYSNPDYDPEKDFRPTKIYSLYNDYGYTLHKLVRFNIEQDIEKESKNSYVRSARYFFKFMPVGIKKRKCHSFSEEENYIEAFVNEFNKTTQGTDHPWSTTADGHKRRFERLLGKWIADPKPMISRLAFGEGDLFDDEECLLDEDYRFIDVSIENPDELENEYAEDFDSDYILLNPKKTIVNEKPSLSFKTADYINLRNFHYTWDSKHLNLFEYSFIYYVMRLYHSKASPKERAIITFLYLSIHTGIEAKKLITLSFDAPQGAQALQIKEINGRHYILNPSLVVHKDKQSSHCLEASPFVYVPVPDTVFKLIHTLYPQGPIFSYPHKQKQKSVKIGDIKTFIKKRINNDKYNKFRLRISLPKISASFLPLYSQRFGLDPMICTLVSGRDYDRIRSSEAHYIYIPHEKLERKYLRAVALADQRILDNYRDNIKMHLIPNVITTTRRTGTRKVSICDSPFLPTATYSDNVNVDNVVKGYGSRAIPEDAYVKSAIDTMKKKIEQEEDQINKHNMFTTYTYFSLQFATALRPQYEPELNWDHLNNRSGTLYIRDKQSAKHHEERILPLPDCILSLLTKLHKGFNKLRKHISLNHYPSIWSFDQGKIFFFINKNGKVLNFDLDVYKTTLKSLIPDYDLPMNMPRHYFRTYLYQKKLSNDIAEAYMGHQHSGREMMNLSSTTDLARAQEIILPKIEQMLSELGIRDVKYI